MASDTTDNPDKVDPNSYNPLPLGPPTSAQGGHVEELGELGYSPPKAPIAATPPGYGRFILPHVSTFTSISNLVSRTYLSTFDEARLDNVQNALVMRRDPIIMDALRSRQIPAVQLDWHLEPDNANDRRQRRMVAELEKVCKRIPRLQEMRMQLMEDVWYGRYAVQCTYEWSYANGFRQLVVRDHLPVQGDKLMFRFSGQVAILVHGAYRGPVIYTDLGRAHPLNPSEREQLIISQYEPEDADYLEGEMAGKRFGVGMRSRIYWWWWQRNVVSQWMFDFLQTVGAGGLTIYYYEEGNAKSYQAAQQAANNQQTNQAVLMPRRKGVGGAIEEINKVERIEPSNNGAQLLLDIINDYFNEQIRAYIKGEKLTTRTGSTGLGSNVAEAHENTATRITRYDATRQQEPWSYLVQVLQRHTYRDLPPERCPVRWVFDVEQPDPEKFLTAAKTFTSLGGELDENQVRGVMGFRKPDAGAEKLYDPTVRQQVKQLQQQEAMEHDPGMAGALGLGGGGGLPPEPGGGYQPGGPGTGPGTPPPPLPPGSTGDGQNEVQPFGDETQSDFNPPVAEDEYGQTFEEQPFVPQLPGVEEPAATGVEPLGYEADRHKLKRKGAKVRQERRIHRYAADLNKWQPYTGPRNGRGWRNIETGEVVHGERPPIRHAKEAIGPTLSAAEVLDLVQQSPQWQEHPKDWPAYAEKYGIQGRFALGVGDPQKLREAVNAGKLRVTKNIDPEDVRRKEESHDWHDVIIADQPGRGPIVVDGNHSLQAAINAGAHEIGLIVAVDRAGEFLEHAEGKAARPAKKAGGEHEFSSTQFNLPPVLADKVLAFASQIPDRALAEDGREDEPQTDPVNEPDWSGPAQPIANRHAKVPYRGPLGGKGCRDTVSGQVDYGGDCTEGTPTKASPRQAVVNALDRRYTRLEARYGRKGATAVLAATLLLAPVPLPGAALLPVGLAEAARLAARLRRKST